MERNMFAEQGCFQKRDSFFDFTVRRWTENGIMRSPLTTDFGESNRRLFGSFGFFFPYDHLKLAEYLVIWRGYRGYTLLKQTVI